MENTFKLSRPTTLIDGAPYLSLERAAAGAARLIPVTFLAYTACPAFVVVSDGESRLRCPRADLFDLEDVAEWV
jgi:hypothetical protein